jgi:hypothetical protein
MTSHQPRLTPGTAQDNLHSEHGSPVPFSPEDITALLPSDESDWAFGRIPAQRAALAGTGAAEHHPHLTSLPSRSLFATLLQAHSLWGKVARRACRTDLSEATMPPWADKSDFLRTVEDLSKWEADIPRQHAWSVWNMRGHSAESMQTVSLVSLDRHGSMTDGKISRRTCQWSWSPG